MFYDVGEKRVGRVLKTARRYLTWIQNSVLEGDLSPATFEALKADVRKILDLQYDSVLFYAWRTERYMSREVVGVDRDPEALSGARRRLEATPWARVLDADIMDAAAPETLGRFETVTCVAVLHHLPLEAGLARLGGLVAPGGRLVVVGLAASRSVWDWLLSGLSVIPVRVASRWHHETRDIGVRTARPCESLSQIRAAARRLLPGARVRRRFYYRYTLVWDRPEGA